MKFISCGKFDKAYIYFFIIYFIFVLLLLYIRAIGNNNLENRIVFYMFFENIGQIFCFIPEIIIDKFCFKQKEKENSNKLNNLLKKEKQTLAIELIFNDFSYKLNYKDILYISCACLFQIEIYASIYSHFE